MPSFGNNRKILDKKGRFFRLDDYTNAQNFIDYAHHEIHEGKSYCAGVDVTNNSGVSHILTLTTSHASSEVHLLFKAAGSGVGNISIYENAVSSGGSGILIKNHQRNATSPNSSSLMTITQSATVTTTGTLMTRELFGSSQIAGGSIRADNEWILKRNSKYAIYLQSNAASNRTVLSLNWYETSSAS
jgi:hypothetical protein